MSLEDGRSSRVLGASRRVASSSATRSPEAVGAASRGWGVGGGLGRGDASSCGVSSASELPASERAGRPRLEPAAASAPRPGGPVKTPLSGCLAVNS